MFKIAWAHLSHPAEHLARALAQLPYFSTFLAIVIYERERTFVVTNWQQIALTERNDEVHFLHAS